ncbi:MAG: E3 ubiquitin-protein ligase SlrP [Chlamydiae bacterium]|nr:E3 ubiquitin-protein ligase SlrP [Chlamydiota bacterium]
MARISDASIVSTGSLSEDLLDISPNFREGSSSRQDAASPLRGRTVSNASSSSTETRSILDFSHEILAKILGYVPLSYNTEPEKTAAPTQKRKSYARRAISSATKRVTSVFRRKGNKSKVSPAKDSSIKKSRESISDTCHLFRDIRIDYENWKELAEKWGIHIKNLVLTQLDIQEECQEQIPRIVIDEVRERVSSLNKFLDKDFPVIDEMLKALDSTEPMKISAINGILKLRDIYTFYIYFARSYGKDSDIYKSLPRLENASFSEHEKALNEWFENYIDVFKDREFLNLKNLQLRSLPECISELTELKSMLLEGNYLTKLPDWILDLKQLMRLDVSRNNLTKLPKRIGELTHLTRFNASRNNLTKIPKSVKDLQALRQLSLDHNKLSSFPKGFENLPALSWLHMNDNAFTVFPEEIEKLQSLRTVDVGNNFISVLPDSLVKSQKLHEIGIAGNPISELPNGLPQEEDFTPGTILYDNHTREFRHEGPKEQ